MQHLMDSFDDSTHAGSARSDAPDVGDFGAGFLAASDFDPVSNQPKSVPGDPFYLRLVALGRSPS